jgi:membrane associated rhomboid family serine protease
MASADAIPNSPEGRIPYEGATGIKSNETKRNEAMLMASVLGLNAINVAVYSMASPPPSFQPLRNVSAARAAGSAMLASVSHVHPTHLALNMAAFTWLSSGLREDRHGAAHVLSLYGCGALGGAAGHSIAKSLSGAKTVLPAVRGASGAVCAVAAALPFCRGSSATAEGATLPLIPPVTIPASWGSALILMALLNPRDIMTKGGLRLSVGSHCGGAFAGCLYGMAFVSRASAEQKKEPKQLSH